MVEHRLDAVFHSLADPTRRDILRRVARRELPVGDIAAAYVSRMSLAAVSKHIAILEEARLVRKRRKGREHYVAASPPAMKEALRYLERFDRVWEERMDRLAAHLSKK